MAHLIDRDALVAEIEKTYKFHEKRGNEHDSSICDVLYGLFHRIDTLEVKDVDLENEIKEVQRHYKTIEEYEGYPTHIYATGIELIAKHFFELGLNAQKG